MNTRSIKVEIRNGGGVVDADLVTCPDCDRPNFLIYYPRSDASHPHLQCSHCDKTFCGRAGQCGINSDPVDTSG